MDNAQINNYLSELRTLNVKLLLANITYFLSQFTNTNAIYVTDDDEDEEKIVEHNVYFTIHQPGVLPGLYSLVSEHSEPYEIDVLNTLEGNESFCFNLILRTREKCNNILANALLATISNIVHPIDIDNNGDIYTFLNNEYCTHCRSSGCVCDYKEREDPCLAKLSIEIVN